MNLADDASCVYCKAPLETLRHAFIVCSTVVNLWKEIEKWLQSTVDTQIILMLKKLLFGIIRNISLVEPALQLFKLSTKNHKVGKNTLLETSNELWQIK